MEIWYRADFDLIEIKEFLIKEETKAKVIEHDGSIWPKVSKRYVFAKTKELAKDKLIEQFTFKIDQHIQMTHTYERMKDKAEKL